MYTSTGAKGGSRSFGAGATSGCELPDVRSKLGSSGREVHAFNCRGIFPAPLTPPFTFNQTQISQIWSLHLPWQMSLLGRCLGSEQAGRIIRVPLTGVCHPPLCSHQSFAAS